MNDEQARHVPPVCLKSLLNIRSGGRIGGADDEHLRLR